MTPRRLADFLERLAKDQPATRSLCDARTVREVLGHLVMPFAGSLPSLLVRVVRARGSIDAASAGFARDLAQRPVPELTALLRERADEVVRAPGVGPRGQLADGCVHLRDCARPLGLPDDVGLEQWRALLDWFSGGVRGLVPAPRLEARAMPWRWPSPGVPRRSMTCTAAVATTCARG
ncbi:maleylpyruvate isomerase N-terminal domain-containing protein [Nocardioides nanhaiensis]|uniref:Mycothiol-dependent maleylpyruvate isomerase metal-binding domain-containing protein n=1 Tax=Nocardioides nanhaiensis TaxID=1476871 RepID=A0ABP8WX47_9ACTN